MDQDAFRSLLASGSSAHARPSVTINDWKGKSKKKEADSASSAPAFKPRNLKKPTEVSRDQATARRTGANDRMDIERTSLSHDLAEDADMVEDQQDEKLGNERVATVKGLDFNLLRQQKAKMYESQDVDDEEALEQVFQELSTAKRKTREELVADLKKSRKEGGAADKPLETAKEQGKFRPIGAPVEAKSKKRKVKGDEKDGEKKKKKRKVEITLEDPQEASNTKEDISKGQDDSMIPVSKPRPRPRTPSPDIDPDADIFADAEEFHGITSGSDSDSDGQETRPQPATKPPKQMSKTDSTVRKDWFGEAKDEDSTPVPVGRHPSTESGRAPVQTQSKEAETPEEGEEEEELKPVRLQGLASSTVPSIREILALDEAAEREEKRKAKKEKRNKKKNPTEETKINREVKQLEQYVAKKAK